MTVDAPVTAFLGRLYRPHRLEVAERTAAVRHFFYWLSLTFLDSFSPVSDSVSSSDSMHSLQVSVELFVFSLSLSTCFCCQSNSSVSAVFKQGLFHIFCCISSYLNVLSARVMMQRAQHTRLKLACPTFLCPTKRFAVTCPRTFETRPSPPRAHKHRPPELRPVT